METLRMNVKSVRWNPAGKAATTSLDALSRSFVTNIGYRFLDNSGVNDSADIITFTLIAKVTETTNDIVIEDIKTSTLDRGLSIHNIGVSTHNESPWGQVETESIPSNTLPSTALQFLGDLHGVLGFSTSFPTSTNSTESLSIDKAFDILEEILIASEPATPIGVSEDSSDLPINVTSVCKITNNVINFTFNQVNGVTFTSATNYDQGPAIATVCYNMSMANKVFPSFSVDDFNSRSNLSSSINNDSIAESIIYEKLSNLNTVTQDIFLICDCGHCHIVNPSDEKSSTADTKATPLDNNSSNALGRSLKGDTESMYNLPTNSVIASIIGHETYLNFDNILQDDFLNLGVNNDIENRSYNNDNSHMSQGLKNGSRNDNDDHTNQSSKKYSHDDDNHISQGSNNLGENDMYDINDSPINVAIPDIIDNETYLNFDNILQDDFLNLGVNNDIENRSYNNDNSHMSQGLKNGSRNDNDDHISQSSKKYSHDDDMYDINDSPINIAISDIIDNETDINFDNIDTNNNTKTGSHDNDNSRMSKYLKGGSHDNGNDDYDDKYMNQDSKISGESNMYNTQDLLINVEVVDTIDYGTHLIMMSTFLSTPDE